jgi:thiamine-phosphate pyrophosphorylase
MDKRLLAWGRAVKQRRHAKLPPLWLFTDFVRAPNPLPAISALPAGLFGIVFRHDSAPNRTELAAAVVKLCRARRIPLVIAGDARLAAALKAGVHLRAGLWPGYARVRGLVTSSAHGGAEMRRARKAGANIVFLSPAFPTASHQGAPALGAARWARLSAGHCHALGGVTGENIRRLPALGAGAIGALM